MVMFGFFGRKSSEISQFIQAKISAKKVVVFSKSYCPYCHKAEAIFQKYLDKQLPRDQYEVVDLTRRPNCSEIQDELKKITGARTVPRVFVNGKCIGGGTETVKLHESGQLYRLLVE